MEKKDWLTIKRENMIFILQKCKDKFLREYRVLEEIDTCIKELLYLLLAVKECLCDGIKERRFSGGVPSVWSLLKEAKANLSSCINDSILTIEWIPVINRQDNLLLMCWILDGIMRGRIEERIQVFINKNTMIYKNYHPEALILHSTGYKVIEILGEVEKQELLIDICRIYYGEYKIIEYSYLFTKEEHILHGGSVLSIHNKPLTMSNFSANESSISLNEKEESRVYDEGYLPHRPKTQESHKPFEKQSNRQKYISLQNTVFELQKKNEEKAKLIRGMETCLDSIKKIIENSDGMNDDQRQQLLREMDPFNISETDSQSQENVNGELSIKELSPDSLPVTDTASMKSLGNIVDHEAKRRQSDEKLKCLKMELRSYQTCNEELLLERSQLNQKICAQKVQEKDLQKTIQKKDETIKQLGERIEKILYHRYTLKEKVFINEDAEWLPDNSANKCMECSAKFSLILRKHHCRKCGKIFCTNCCSNFISFMRNTPRNRVCKSCYYLTTSGSV